MEEELIEENQEEEVIQPEVVNQFKSPFGGRIGFSSVDLSDKNAENEMLNEYNTWFGYGRTRNLKSLGFPYTREEDKEERNRLRNEWYLKYHGMPYESYQVEKDLLFKEEGGFYPGANNPIESLKNTYEGLSIPGMAWADFITDAAGTVLPGFNRLDDRWDEATKFDNEIYQGLRRILSVVLPAIQTGKFTVRQLQSLPAGMPKLTRALIGTGAFSLQEASIIGLSDLGEDQTVLGTISEVFPGIFGPKGVIPVPNQLIVQEGDSTSVRKWKNMLETGGLSVFGTVLGAYLQLKSGKKILDWFQPLDDAAGNYKQLELEGLTEVAQPDKLIRLRKIEELLSTKKLSKQNENILINEKLNIESELGMVDDIEGLVERDVQSRAAESTAARARKLVDTDPNVNQLELFPKEFDVDITPGILDESGEARQTIPPANVARNMADTTSIKNGATEGDPAPIITDAMRQKGLMVGQTSRGAVMGVAEETRSLGRFDALVDGFRFSNKQMNAAAWDIYTSIIDPGASLDDVRALFYENKDVTNLLMGRFKIESINEEQARAAAFAMRDLVDRFLGREVSEASARAMDTLGREAATMAQSIKQLTPFVDDYRAMDLIIEKLEFLMDEYALNKYISGWRLRNKNWFDQIPPKELDTVIEQLTEEFVSAENAIHAKNVRFTNTLKNLKKTKPSAMRPLVDAFAHTNGDVDTLAKLMKWSAEQITPTGLIKSPDPKQMNLFAKAMWSVRYNNVLSGLSAVRATVGNTSQLIIRPMTAILGHGLTGNIDGIRRTLYYNTALFETNRRALNDAFSMMKKAHQDPDLFVKSFRKDFIFQEGKTWSIMKDMEKVYLEDGNWGRLTQLRTAELLQSMGKNKALRYGMTGLVFPDAFAGTHLAHYLSRVRAYDDVISEFGYFKKDAITKAEMNHYKTMFDENGLIKDKTLKAITGEISLNIDDGLSKWLNEGTTAYPILKDFMMFPRTSSNWIKNSASYTPIQAIPGINKYSKTIWAQSDEDITTALAEHGIDFASTPNARVIFENLRAEYIGRMAFSGMLVGTLYHYAMSGNIRGNGHYNASRRTKERDEMGYIPKTINIAGKWVSYEGIIGVEQILSMIGDFAYYRADLDQALIEDWQAKITWSIAATFLNETPLQGLEPLLAGLNGDFNGWNRLIANSARSYLPMSGGAGVTAKAISPSLKDIEGSVQDYIKNRLPGLNTTLVSRKDIWTGDAINDVDNPVLKVLNAINPFSISGTSEPWRQWLLESGWDGISVIKKSYNGKYTYSIEERGLIYDFIGEQKPYKKLISLMKNKEFQSQIAQIKAHRKSSQGTDDLDIQLKTKLLPVYRAITGILREAQKKAEIKLAILAREQPDKYGHISQHILNQILADSAMKAGNVERAIEVQKIMQDKRKLLQYGNK